MVDERNDKGETERALRNAFRALPPGARRGLLEALQQISDREMPTPHNSESGQQFEQRMGSRRGMIGDRELFEFPAHLRKWFDSLSEDDVGRLNKVIALSPKTLDWLCEKNPKELQTLDDAVEFVSSSRTAAKVLMYVTGVAVTVMGAAFAWAKGAYEWFAILKVPPK